MLNKTIATIGTFLTLGALLIAPQSSYAHWESDTDQAAESSSQPESGAGCPQDRPYDFFYPRPSSFIDFAVGKDHSCAIDSRRLLYCWGNGDKGQLGHPSCYRTQDNAPVRIRSTLTYKSVIAGDGVSCALDIHGDTYCWGDGRGGTLGDGNTEAHHAKFPSLVRGQHKFVKISMGNRHVCGIDGYNDVYCWGSNSHGQLGKKPSEIAASGTPIKRVTPFKMTDIWIGGDTSCAVAVTGKLFCWGKLAKGDREEARDDGDFLHFTRAAVGQDHICAIDKYTDVSYCWGQGGAGRLGDGDTDEHFQRRFKIVNKPHTYNAISAGAKHTCALTRDREVYCWGDNSIGQLAQGKKATQQIGVPTAIGHGKTFVAIDAFGDRTCALQTDNQLYCWGDGRFGALGNGKAREVAKSPVRVAGFPARADKLDEYCQELAYIKAETTKAKHPAVLEHNTGTEIPVKGCAYLSPLPRSKAHKESVDKSKLRRAIQGIVGNFSSTDKSIENVCQLDISAVIDRLSKRPGSDKWEMVCDKNTLSRRIHVEPFRMRVGKIVRAHDVLDIDRAIKPGYGICAISNRGSTPFTCQENPCKDDKERYYGPGDLYGEAVTGQPRAVGKRCRAVECRSDINTRGFYEEVIDVGANWVWVKDSDDDFACRPIENGCFFEGQFYKEGESRAKKAEFHFSSERDNTQCTFNRYQYTCKKRPSEPFAWQLESVATVKGSRQGQQCAPIDGCLDKGAMYKVGQSVVSDGPIRFSSTDALTPCSYSQMKKSCERKTDGNTHWKNISFNDVKGYRTGNSCVPYEGCFHNSNVYKEGEARTYNDGKVISTSNEDGAQCHFNTQELRCVKTEGVLGWKVERESPVNGIMRNGYCAELAACYDPATKRIIGEGRKMRTPSTQLGENMNSPCSVVNAVSECVKKDGRYLLRPAGTEAILERGWTFKPKEPAAPARCEQHKNCIDRAGHHMRHGQTLRLQEPIEIRGCYYYQTHCSHGEVDYQAQNCPNKNENEIPDRDD